MTTGLAITMTNVIIMTTSVAHQQDTVSTRIIGSLWNVQAGKVKETTVASNWKHQNIQEHINTNAIGLARMIVRMTMVMEWTQGNITHISKGHILTKIKICIDFMRSSRHHVIG